MQETESSISTQANFFEKEPTDGGGHKRLFYLIVSTLKNKRKKFMWLSIYQNFITPVPIWIADTGHRMGERNVRVDSQSEMERKLLVKDM
ncbi:hypothetical protein TNCV_3342541 [Trichonephila clavipes]|nr:hypothetical protein TNCV_3342541 [Trichonephila clavipes]